MKVLIVDDNSENLYLLESILKGIGYITVSANNGAEALGLARKDIPDLIITDILMPVMDGFTLCREFKKDEKLCNVPFIFYTATYSDPRDEELAFSLGADRFILKPQDPEVFITIVKELLKEDKKINTHTAEAPSIPEIVILKEYNETLVRKLEDKMLKIEQSEREIRKNNILLLKEIEERKHAEELLRKSEERFKQVSESLQESIWEIDNEGLYTFVSPVIEELLGYKTEEIIGIKYFYDFFEPHNREVMKQAALAAFYRKEKFKDFINVNIHKDGRKIILSTHGFPILDKENNLIGYRGVDVDITERERAEKAVRENEKFLKETQKIAQLGSYDFDINTGIWKSSEILDSIFGIEPDFDKSIDGWTSIIHPEWQQLMADYFANEVIGLKKPFDKEYKIIRRSDKAERWVHGLGELVIDNDNKPIQMIGTIKDITELKSAEQEIINLNRIYALLSNTNQTIVRVKDRQRLFDEICRIAIDDGKFRMTWIGLVNHNTNKIDVAASAGFIENYLENMNLDLNDEIRSQGPTGRAVKIGKHFISNDIENDKKMLPWKENALRLGYKSSIAFPLKVFGKVIGAFTIYASQKDFFHEQEIRLLDEMAMDISFALEFLETEKNRIKSEENLYQSEERFRSLYENSTIGLYRTTPDGKILLANPTLVKMLGYSSFEELATRDLEKEGFESTSERKQFSEATEIKGEVKGFESAWTRKDGTTIYVSESAKAIRDSDGTTLCYDGTVENITERKKAEDALHKSEIRFKQVSDNAQEWIWEVDKNGLYTYSSPIVKEILGYEPEELIGKKYFYDFFDPEIKEDLIQAALGAFVNRANFKDFVNYNIHKDGRKIILSTSGIPIVDKEDNLIGYRGVDVDITERKRAEEELKKSEEKYRSIFENVQDVYYETSFDGTILEVSPSIEFMSKGQYRRADLIGRSMYEFYVDTENREAIISAMQKEGRVNDFEVRFKNQDGSAVPCSISAKINLDAKGRPEKIIGSMHDITERKKAEKLTEALYRISQAIYSTENIDKFYQHIHRDLSSIIPAQNFFIALLTDDEKKLYLPYNQDEKDADELWVIDADDPQSLIIEVLRSKRPLLLNEKELNDRYSSGKNRVWGTAPKCWLGVPLMIREKAIGVIAIQDYNKDEVYNQQDVSLFESAAGQIAIAIERKRAEEALRDSEERFRMVFENVFDGIALYREDPDPQKRTLIECNERYAILSGRSREELLKIGNTLGLQKTLEEMANDSRMEFLNRGAAYQGSFSWIRPDGKENVIEYVGMPITWRGKSYTIGIDRDITERKRKEKEIVMLANALKSVDQCVSITDMEDKIIFINQSFLRTYGYREDEIIGKDMNIFRSQKNPPALIEEILPSTLNGGWNGELWNKRKDGSEFLISLTTRLIEDKDDKFFGLIGVASDITERKQAEEKIKIFSAAVEDASDCFVLTNMMGDVTYANESSLKTFGYSLAEMLKLNVSQFSTNTEDLNIIYESISKKEGWNGEINSVKKNKEIFPVILSISLVKGDNNNPIGMMGIFRDITEQKHAATQLMEAKEKAEEMSRLKSNFLANMSHELRTPLVGILGYADILRQDIKLPEMKVMAETIYKSGSRLSETLNLILDLSKFETEKRDIKYQKIDLVSKTKEIITLFSETAHKKGVSLNSSFSQEPIIINLDERAFHSILNNLINNALKFTNEGSVTTAISLNNDFVDIKVIDTGIGIAEKDYQIIFEEFRQVSEGYSRNFEGSGLGLSITKKLVEKFGGSISVESEIGKGSTFTVKLPASNAKDKGKDPIVKEALNTKNTPKKKSTKSLALLVDDDPLVQQILNRYISEYVELETTVDAEFAIKMLKKKQYDLIFMDINLRRGMDGKQATKRIRTMKGYESIPIIATTAYAMVGDKEEFLAAGCTHYLSKPFSKVVIEELLEKVLKLA